MDKASILGEIPSQWPRTPNYCHSFGLTENYIVFIEQPAYLNFLAFAMSRIRERTAENFLKFCPGYEVSPVFIQN